MIVTSASYLGWVLSRRFCKGHKHPQGSPGALSVRALCQFRASAAKGGPFPGVSPGPGRCFQLRLSPWSCQTSSSCCPATKCLVMGSSELQPPVGQHASLRAQGGAQCPRSGLHLLQRLRHKSKLKHRNENQKFRFKVEFALSVAVSNLKISVRMLSLFHFNPLTFHSYDI